MIKHIITAFLSAFILLGHITEAKINKSFDVRTKSNVSHHDIEKHLDGKLKGTGAKFAEVEEKYGVNAAFLAAIAIFESGNGKSNKAKSRNNCFGLKGKTFKSIHECIEYAAKLISSPTGCYFGRKRYTIEHIARTYAPLKDGGGNHRWVPSVVSIMRKILAENKLNTNE